MQKKISAIILYFIPICVMIGFIPLVASDYLLTAIYIACIVILMLIKSEKNDLSALVFGLIGITVSEYIFVSTGVETFAKGRLGFWTAERFNP